MVISLSDEAEFQPQQGRGACLLLPELLKGRRRLRN